MHGLYIEGARFDLAANQLARSHPKVLVEELAILAVEPIEAHRLKLQVGIASGEGSWSGGLARIAGCLCLAVWQ